MRRQGRQHGIVRTYRILPPPLNPRLVNFLTSPQTSELFTKSPSKPTKPHRKMWPGQVHWVISNIDIVSSSYKQQASQIRTEPGPEYCEDSRREARVEEMKRDEKEKEENGGSNDDEDESMSYYDVGMMMMEHVLDDDEEADGWCLVRILKSKQLMMSSSRGSAFSFSFESEYNLICLCKAGV